MKALKYFFIGVGILVAAFVMLGFIYFASQPSPPKAMMKISENDWNLDSQFHQLNKTYWEKINRKLIFNNQSTEIEKATLQTKLMPSENKKQGYITTSVTVSGILDSLTSDCVFGFQLGEENASAKEQLTMGVNGNGEIVVLDGALNPLFEEKIKTQKPFTKHSAEKLELSFHYYKNPYGWIIFFSAKNDTEHRRQTINYIPFEKLDSPHKELSLIVFNPSQKGNIGFENWKIQNDWTPND